MKEWIFDVFEENLEYILDSGKEVEGRVPDIRKPQKAYHLIKPDDIVTFRIVDKNINPLDGIRPVSFMVSYNKRYDSVRDYLESEGLNRALPEAKDIEEGISLYHSLPGYKERIADAGIHAIGLGKRIS